MKMKWVLYAILGCTLTATAESIRIENKTGKEIKGISFEIDWEQDRKIQERIPDRKKITVSDIDDTWDKVVVTFADNSTFSAYLAEECFGDLTFVDAQRNPIYMRWFKRAEIAASEGRFEFGCNIPAQSWNKYKLYTRALNSGDDWKECVPDSKREYPAASGPVEIKVVFEDKNHTSYTFNNGGKGYDFVRIGRLEIWENRYQVLGCGYDLDHAL